MSAMGVSLMSSLIKDASQFITGEVLILGSSMNLSRYGPLTWYSPYPATKGLIPSRKFLIMVVLPSV